jgi:hypothetical protein
MVVAVGELLQQEATIKDITTAENISFCIFSFIVFVKYAAQRYFYPAVGLSAYCHTSPHKIN